MYRLVAQITHTLRIDLQDTSSTESTSWIVSYLFISNVLKLSNEPLLSDIFG